MQRSIAFVIWVSIALGILLGGCSCTGREEREAFVEAAARGDAAAVRLALTRGVDPDVLNAEGMSAMHAAVDNAERGIVALLIRNGADVNRRGYRGYTPLHEAAGYGLTDMARYLLENGAEASIRNNEGQLPLHLALSSRSEETIAVLAGATDERDVFILAGLGDRPGLREALSDRPALANARDGLGRTPLHYAAGAGRLNTCQLLIRSGGQVNAKDKTHQTPLARAIDRAPVVAMLLEAGADPNVIYTDSMTVLHIAAWRGMQATVAELLAHGADPDVTDSEGRTPLALAEGFGRDEAAAMLRNATASNSR